MQEYKGMPAASGIVWARAVVAQAVETGKTPETLNEAVDACLVQVRALYQKTLAELGPESAEIFSAYEALLTDHYLLDPIQELQAQGKPLPEAIETALEQRAQVFLRAKSDYLRDRAEDIRNIKEMLLHKVNGSAMEFFLPPGNDPVIVVAPTLSPADTMALDKTRLAGFITQYGGATSHVVILAKNLGIPAITGVQELPGIPNGSLVLMDGSTGVVTVQPDEETLAAARVRLDREKAFEAELRELPAGKTCTQDGTEVHISVNIGGAADLEGLDLTSLHGVGLYRTEFLYVERDTAPTRDEQVEAYRRVFDAVDGRDLIVRTLDIGGDKNVPYLDLPQEDNPFLGCRGIRLCLQHEPLLRDQFAALLRAANGRAFSVMFPMVNDVAEFRRAKAIWQEVCAAEQAEGVPVSDGIRLGVMIETPSALLCADALAACVDFASIGTNDLTQYILAADRGNPRTGVSLSVYAPAVVRAIHHIIRTFARQGVKLSVCGEAGSDLHFLPLMLGMGLRYVSVSRSMADRVRYTVLHTDLAAQAARLEQVLQLQTEPEIRAALCGGKEDA